MGRGRALGDGRALGGRALGDTQDNHKLAKKHSKTNRIELGKVASGLWVSPGACPQVLSPYPSYCSKYNPIERRLFSQISRVRTGMLFDTLDTVVTLMRKATTSTGLKTTVNVIRRIYETGRNATEAIKQNVRSSVEFDKIPAKWNYTIKPQN